MTNNITDTHDILCKRHISLFSQNRQRFQRRVQAGPKTR